MEMYTVGGCVRDEILGTPSKDIDFTVVIGDGDYRMGLPNPYDVMVLKLERMGIKIIRGKDGVPVGADFLTARGIAPKNFPKYPGRALDFVLARKERDYGDGRRPDFVEPGTLMDDLQRRDFTMNAIAKDSEGNLIDPFGGVQDIANRRIRCVGAASARFAEDALRAVRALRFSVTKGFEISPATKYAMQLMSVLDAIESNVSDERKQVELSKMFNYDTLASLAALNQFPQLTRALFSGSVRLDATMKQAKGK